jgi:hypothetical protein
VPYTRVTLRQALARLSAGDPKFVWEEKTGEVHDTLKKQPEFQRATKVYEGQGVANMFLEYCWLAYAKALRASGPQIIGRRWDVWRADVLSRAQLSDTQTLWDPDTQGNIQKLDKWAPTVNDCWVLGGIHRRADFELLSVRTLSNLWDYKGVDGKALHIVTAREIIGVLNFGYAFKVRSDTSLLSCVDTGKANAATVGAYDELMQDKEQMGPESIRSLLQLDPSLQKGIREFDKSKLKHVVPPR